MKAIVTKSETPARKAIGESELWKKKLGDWVLNPFVGCEHGCFHCYCPSMPGVKFFNGKRSEDDWGKYLIEKTGFVDAVKRQLVNFTPAKAKRTDWGDGWVLMSFLTDCYTPAEAKLKLTRQCLQLLLEAGHKVRVQTRSALIERDFDILRAHADRVLVGTSLPYLSDSLARRLEPRAAAPSRRLQMLRKAREAGLEIYAAVAPVMPWTSMSEFREVLVAVDELGPREIFCEALNPKGDNIGRMVTALGRRPEAEVLSKYDDERWANTTFAALYSGLSFPKFVPWPDTSRRWAQFLEADQVALLDTFLPPRSKEDHGN